jgi:hypothetical protein
MARLTCKNQVVLFPRYHTDYQYGPYRLRGIRPHAHFWHTSMDGSWEFTTNGKGLRDTREFPYAKAPGTLRVLALGDSNTQGYEVRQDATFSAVLERYLDAHGTPAEVLNAGVSGFGTAEELAYLENEGFKYQPDVVVLGFFANDFEDNLKAGLFDLEGDALVARSFEHLPGVAIQNVMYGVPGVRWLSENSYAYSLLFNGVWVYFKERLRERAVRDQPADVDYTVPMASGYSRHELALTAALIARMQRDCRERGVRLIVVDIPSADDHHGFTSSMPAAALAFLPPGLEYLGSRDVLGGLEGSTELHVPHGQRHISEVTHAKIGVALGGRILQ